MEQFEKKILPVFAFLLIFGFGGCKKDIDCLQPHASKLSNESTVTNSNNNSISQKSLVTTNFNILPVNLGLAGKFALLAKSGITDVYKSSISGDVGSSPISGTATLLACDEVRGTIYSVDAAGPAPCVVTNAARLTQAVSDMQTAYADASGRSNPKYSELGAGDIGGRTLAPGLYKWTSCVTIPTDITLAGGPTDVWIFQISGTLIMASAVKVNLFGGAQAKNIFWQVADAVTLGTTSHMEGVILGSTGINMRTGATLNGRMLAQTAITLQMNTITEFN